MKKILTYNFTVGEITGMRKKGIVNGCGGKGENIELPMKGIIGALPGYNEEKAEQLFKDLQQICYEHDYEYWLKKGFYSSNFRMAIKVFKLLHWSGYKRFFVAFTLFVLLNRYGRKFYS